MPWPRIEGFEHRYHFNSPEQMYLAFTIKDTGGKDVYFVECASPGTKDPNATKFAYSRDFECRVAVPGATLLPDIQLLATSAGVTKEWQSRGGFWWNELTPRCSAVPGWGAKRTYSFRGIAMTINITDVKLVKNVEHSKHQPIEKLQGLTVILSGRADPNATNAYGGASPYREPPLRSVNEEYGFRACNGGSRPK
jgi:hypothetical protein